MNRTIVYPAALPLDTDILQPQQNTMVALGYALQAAYAQNTVFLGLACAPTAPASMQVTIGPGAIITPSVIEPTPFGSLQANSTDPLVKMGINTTASTFTLTAPLTSGQSQNYLIEASFSEADDTPATLTYFNSLNPNQPYSGPANSGTPQNTRRAQVVSLIMKAGVPANTGTQVTPPVDSGWSGLYIITVSFAQTAITTASIAPFGNTPFLAPFLNSHHGGVPGQAPKINLPTEVQGIIPAVNLPVAVGYNLVFAGNPNGNVSGTAASGSLPPVMCWDTTDQIWWTCVTTGTATSAVWSAGANFKNMQAFTSSGTFTVPVGVTRVRFTVTGGGGGGSNCAGGVPASGSTDTSGGGGGAGGTAIGIYNVTPGQAITITVGNGGTAQTSGGASSAGTLCSATGGGASTFQAAGNSAGGTPGIGTGGQINLTGGYGSDGQSGSLTFAGNGGSSYWGGGSRAYAAGGSLTQAGAYGSGGGGSYGTAAGTGITGVAGIVRVEW